MLLPGQQVTLSAFYIFGIISYVDEQIFILKVGVASD